MNIIIFITTYNRSDELKDTLKSLVSDKDFLAHNNVVFEVYDDKSDYEHSLKNMKICQAFGTKYLTSDVHFGKFNFWQLHKKIFKKLSHKEFDYAFSLQDDFEYTNNFLSKAIEIFKDIEKENNKFVCLNLRDDRIGKIVTWTNLRHQEKNINNLKLHKVGWVDCVYLANKKFFEILNFKVFPIDKKRFKNSKISSGVGRQMSKRIVNSNHSIYQLKNPISKHLMIQSQMNSLTT